MLPIVKCRIKTVEIFSFVLCFQTLLLKVEGHGINDNNPFEFRMFENFGLTREVFIKEQEMVRDLKNYRNLLETEIKILRSKISGLR